MAWSAGSAGLLKAEEFERERLGGPVAKSGLLHLLVVGSLLGYAYAHNLFHGGEWGTNASQEGSIQATLVSSAALPLPQDHPPTDNVLSTETPSPAPAIPEQKLSPIPLPDAIPIPEKPTPAKKTAPPKPQSPPRRQPPPPQQRNKAAYGEAAPANVARATASNANSNSIAVTGGDFGSRFGWYVDVIKQKVAQNWYLQEVQPGTPAGATVYIQFTVARDGSVSDPRISTSSGFPSLDSSGLRAIQRVDNFGPLPPGYNESSLNVLYHFTYPGHQ